MVLHTIVSAMKSLRGTKTRPCDGFIQIPILIALAALGVVATTVGGYYAVQHTKKAEPEEIRVREIAVPVVAQNSQTEASLQSVGTLSKSITKELNLDSYKVADNSKNKKREQLVQQLTAMKSEVDSLFAAELEVKGKLVSSEIKVSDFRIEKIKELANSSLLEVIEKTYEELIVIEEIRKKNTGFFLANSLLDIDLYSSSEIGKVMRSLKEGDFENVFPDAQKLIDAHGQRLDRLKEQSESDIETVMAENKAYAQEFLLRMESTRSLADRYAASLAALQEIEKAKQEIEKITVSVSYGSGLTLSSPAVIQPQTNSSALICKYPTSKYILVPGKGWVAVKQCSDGTYIEANKYVPNTNGMTPQQICDMRKAAWLGQEALVGGTPDCRDLGL